MAGQQVGSISIKVTPDTKLFRSELEAQLKAIEDTVRGNIKVGMELDSQGIREKVKAELAGLDAKVHVKLDVDRSALDKIGPLIPGGGGGGGGNFGGGKFGGLGSFADTAALVAAVAVFLAPALALVSGALATIPALLSAILVPIGAVALGLDGLKKAAEVLKPDLAALKETMSAKFQDVFTPILTKAKDLFPALQASLPNVASGLGRVADAFVNTITSGPGLDRVKNTINNIADTLAVSAPGIASFTNGLTLLAEQVTAKFPQVSQWIDTVGNSFSGWVSKVTQDGSLDTAMGNLGEVLKGFGEIGVDALKQGFDFLKDPQFGQTMKTFVNDTKTLLNDVLPGLKTGFEQLSGFLNQAVGALDKINSFKPPAWMNLDPKKAADQKQGPGAFPGLTKPDQKSPGWLDQLEQRIQDLFSGKALPKDGLNPDNLFGKDTSKGFGDWARGAVGAIGNVFENVNDWLQAPAAKIFDFFKNDIGVGMAQAAAETGPGVGVQLGQSIQQGLLPVTQQIQPALQAALGSLQQIPALIQTAFSGIGAAVQGSMANVVSAVAGAGQQIVAAFSASLSQLPGIATNAFSALAGVATGAMAQVVAAISSGGAQAVASVTSMGQQIVAALQQAASGARAAGAQIGAGLAAGIRESTGGAVAAAQAMAAAVTAASKVTLGVHSPSKVFTEIGAQTAQGLQDGIDGGFQGVVDRATALAQAITDAVNNGLTGVDGSALSDQLKKQIDEIGLEQDQLKNQLNGTTDKGQKGQIKDQRTQLQTIRDQLKQQQDQLGFSQKYGDQLDKNDNILGDSLNKMLDAGKGFAEANLKQAASDLGISGNGAIPQALDQGLSFGMQMLSKLISGAGTQIHVNNVDEALAMKQTLTNRAALQFNQR